jgi:hypothetical protein
MKTTRRRISLLVLSTLAASAICVSLPGTTRGSEGPEAAGARPLASWATQAYHDGAWRLRRAIVSAPYTL